MSNYLVAYQGNREYILTKEEAEQALVAWQDRLPYFCPRLKTGLSPYYMIFEPQKVDIAERRIL